MPTYEYQCARCLDIQEIVRTIKNRNKRVGCKCLGWCERLISMTSTQVWKKDRKFPNTSERGDGTRQFDTKADYDLYKIENHCDELSTDAPKINKLGHKTIYRF